MEIFETHLVSVEFLDLSNPIASMTFLFQLEIKTSYLSNMLFILLVFCVLRIVLATILSLPVISSLPMYILGMDDTGSEHGMIFGLFR